MLPGKTPDDRISLKVNLTAGDSSTMFFRVRYTLPDGEFCMYNSISIGAFQKQAPTCSTELLTLNYELLVVCGSGYQEFADAEDTCMQIMCVMCYCQPLASSYIYSGRNLLP